MVSIAATAHLPRAEPALGWIQSPGWDLFWMFSGLWGAVLVLAGNFAIDAELLVLGLFAGERLVGLAHAWSTTWMVLGSGLMREQRREDRMRYVVLPSAIWVGCFALGYYVAAFQRFPADGRLTPELWAWTLYIGLFWVGHFFHFGQQDFGVLSIYRTKAGQTRTLDRRADRIHASLMMFVIQPIVYLHIIQTTGFAEIARAMLPLGVIASPFAAGAAVSLAALLTLGMIGFEVSKPNRSTARLLYLAVMFLHPFTMYAVSLTGQVLYSYLYFVAYLWSHWMIAIGLVARINSGYYRSEGYGPRAAIARHALVLGLISIVVWWLTRNFGRWMFFNTDQFEYKAILAAISGSDQILILGFFISFFLAEQLIHYYCDRCLFSFRRPGIRATVGRQLFGT